MSATLEELADAWEQAWSGRERAAFARVCATDVHYEDPLTDAPLRGPGAIADHAARLWDAFPDARMERSGERLIGGRFAALPVSVRGTNRARLGSLPASHREVNLHVVFYCQLDAESSRLWRVRGFFDTYGAAVTLGLLPSRGSLRERALLVLQGYGLRPRADIVRAAAQRIARL